jgi:hypothetical protein
MKASRRTQFLAIIFVVGSTLVECPPRVQAQTVGQTNQGYVVDQWDFEYGDLRASIGKDLEYGDGPGGRVETHTSFGTTRSFGIPNIGGRETRVMKYHRDDFTEPAGDANPRGYIVSFDAGPNGGPGSTRANQWTLILDIMWPDLGEGDGFSSLIKCGAPDDFSADGDLFVRGNDIGGPGTGGIGISGAYTGDGSTHLINGRWHRVAIVADMAAATPILSIFIDGVKFQDITKAFGIGFDGRFSLPARFRLFADGGANDEVNTFYVNSIQLRNYAMSAAGVAALGGPAAEGIPPLQGMTETSEQLAALHLVNDLGQNVLDVLKEGLPFTTDFKGTNDVIITELSGLPRSIYLDEFGGTNSADNPAYITNFVGSAAEGNGDGISGDISGIETTQGVSLQFDFAERLTANDRLLVSDCDWLEQYQVRAFVRNGGGYGEVPLSHWSAADYPGSTQELPNSLWPTWNGASGMLVSQANDTGLGEELVVLTPDQSVDRVVITQRNTPGGTASLQFVSPAQPWIGDCERITNGSVELSVSGSLGSVYTLQSSSDLTNWTSRLSFTCTSAPTRVVDPGANTSERQFYRIAVGTLPDAQHRSGSYEVRDTKKSLKQPDACPVRRPMR